MYGMWVYNNVRVMRANRMEEMLRVRR